VNYTVSTADFLDRTTRFRQVMEKLGLEENPHSYTSWTYTSWTYYPGDGIEFDGRWMINEPDE
jgi:hypothetical protein